MEKRAYHNMWMGILVWYISGGKCNKLISGTETTGYYFLKIGPYCISLIKISSRWVKYLNVKVRLQKS